MQFFINFKIEEVGWPEIRFECGSRESSLKGKDQYSWPPGINLGVRKLSGENLKVTWAEFSTLS